MPTDATLRWSRRKLARDQIVSTLLISNIPTKAKILKEHCKYCSQLSPDDLFFDKNSFFARLHALISGSVLDQSRNRIMQQNMNPAIQFKSPFAWVIGRTWFQLAAMVMGVYIFCSTCVTIMGFDGYGMHRFRSFRVEVKLHGKSEITHNISTSRLALLLNGCKVWESDSATELLPGNSHILRLPDFPFAITVNGFEMEFRKTWDTTIPAQIVLKGSVDNETWVSISSSSTRFVAEGVRFLEEYALWSAEKPISFENWLGWPIVLESAVTSVVLGYGCLGLSISGMINRPLTAQRILVSCSITIAAINLIVVASRIWLQTVRDVLFPCFQVPAFLLIAVVVKYAEIVFAESLLAAALLVLFVRVVQDTVVYQDAAYLADAPPVTELVIAFSGLFFMLARARYLAKVRRAAEADRTLYDVEWGRLQALPGALEALGVLQDLAGRLCCGELDRRVRHCNRLISAPATPSASAPATPSVDQRTRKRSSCDFADGAVPVALLSIGVRRAEPGTWDRRRPVGSLDQLYTQAMGLAPSLLAQCKAWGAAAGGCLDAGQDGEPNDSLSGWISRRVVKRPERAIEKAAICYGGDVSRLADVCRARLAFGTLGQICACLELIAQDRSTAQLLRIKNGLDPQSDSWRTVGYRAVVLNLCIVDEETRLLGIENHVCEVQLILKSFLDLVQDPLLHAERHLNFLSFRAVRSQLLGKPGMNSWFSAPKAAAVWPSTGPSLVAAARSSTDTLPRTSAGDGSRGPSLEAVASKSSDVISEVENADAIFSSDLKLFYNIFVTSALKSGGFSGHQESILHEAFIRSSAGSVWFTSTPLVAATSKRVFQAILLIIALFFTYKTVVSMRVLIKNEEFQANVLCMDVKEIRSGDGPAVTPNMELFGPLMDGCKLNTTYQVLNVRTGSTICAYLKDITWMNGYYFITAFGNTYADPVKWTVRASLDNGTTWQPVGASVWRLFGDGSSGFYGDLAFSTPKERSVEAAFDLRPPWPWIVDWVICYIVNCVGFFGCFFGAVTGHNETVKKIWIGFYVLGTLVFGVAALGYHTAGNHRAAAACWLEMGPQLVFVIGVAFYESKIIFLLLSCSFCFVLSLVIDNVVIYSSDFMTTIQSIIQSAGTIAFIFATVVTFFRRRTLNRSRKLVLADKERYDAVWIGIINEEPDAVDILVAISNAARFEEPQTLAMNSICGVVVAAPRQFTRKFATGDQRDSPTTDNRISSVLRTASRELEALGRWNFHYTTIHQNRPEAQDNIDEALSAKLDCERWIPETLDCNRPIKSLDQLFVQASCLHPILLRKVKAWAKASGGCFPCKGHSGFVKAADVPENSSYLIRWAKLKSISRAVEKIYRIYDKDVSRLIDICRQSIVFENLPGIADCLAAIHRDEDVRVVRVKNRMDPMYDSAVSAGYRDVALNLRIVNDETRDLGVESHVCEVQLILKAFAELKNNDGHKRYVQFRNLRGE